MRIVDPTIIEKISSKSWSGKEYIILKYEQKINGFPNSLFFYKTEEGFGVSQNFDGSFTVLAKEDHYNSKYIVNPINSGKLL